MKRAIALLLLCEFLTTGLASAQGVPAQVPPPQQAASVQELLLTADSLVRKGKRRYDGASALAGAKRAATDQQIAQLQDGSRAGKEISHGVL
jgi:hypothetical protein